MLMRPKESFNSTLKDCPGGVVLTTADILRDDNAHVKARPGMFEPVRATFGDTGDGIEDMTSSPGQRRNR